MEKKHLVLLLHADGTQALPMAEELCEAGCVVCGVFASKLSYGYSSRYISSRYVCPVNMKDIDGYYKYLVDLLNLVKPDVVIPLNDESAEVLSKYKLHLSELARYVMPDYDTFKRAYDKQSLMRVCRNNGYPHPETFNCEDAYNACSKLKYPILIKPNITCGARGMTRVDSEIELKSALPMVQESYGSCHLQRFIHEGGAQVEVQLYVDQTRELRASSVIRKYRWYPEQGGSSCFNVSAQNEELVQMLYRLLLDIGWVGFADFDLIEDPDSGDLLVMELNPRVPACLRTAVKSGVNWPQIILHEYLQIPYSSAYKYSKVYLKHFGFEMLWFIYSKKRFCSSPSIFKLWARNLYYQDANWKDPLPFLTGSLGNFFKLFSSSFRKSKSGTRKKRF